MKQDGKDFDETDLMYDNLCNGDNHNIDNSIWYN